MAQPLLDFLTGQARAALPFFKQGVRLGLGANHIIEMVSARIGGIRRQVALDIIAALRGPIETERVLRLVPRTVPIPSELHNPSVVNLNDNYQYVVGAYDVLGENLGHVTVSSDVPISQVQIETAATLLFTETGGEDSKIKEGQLHAIAIEEANISPTAVRE